MEEFKGAMSPETEKKLDDKLVFQNKFFELGDGYLIKILDNKLLSKIIEKLPSGTDKEMVRNIIAEVIDEMPEILI